MKQFVTVAFVLLIILLAPAAAEAAYKCACLQSAEASLEGSTDPKIECSDLYSDYNKDWAVQESQLKLYVTKSNLAQGDKDSNLSFRPRDGKCLLAVYDGNANKALFAGMYCDNGNEKDIGQFDMKDIKKTTPMGEVTIWQATYKAETTGKTYTGFATWVPQQDGKKYLQAACIENK
ncbi:MAG: hypothetical protein FJ197_05635 [Gammaproteobacteria bacterium]|nr:hypothetical protein [Gammaproteobacteria bacterium]